MVAGRYGDVDFYLSQRNSPPLFGLGLIDRVTPQRLAALAKKQAEESSGEIRTYQIPDHGATWDNLQREWRTPPLWGIADTGPGSHEALLL